MKSINDGQREKILTLATTSKEVRAMQTIAKIMQSLTPIEREKVLIMWQDIQSESKL